MCVSFVFTHTQNCLIAHVVLTYIFILHWRERVYTVPVSALAFTESSEFMIVWKGWGTGESVVRKREESKMSSPLA